MSADFWAGYISGAIGILIGNPLDLIKVRLQAGTLSPTAPPPTSPSSPILGALSASTRSTYISQFTTLGTLLRGSSAPILGYGALNALLFMTYNRSSSFLTHGSLTPPNTTTIPPTIANSQQPTLLTTFIAGALGGLATWVISTPTELVKCRAQVSSSTSLTPTPTSSYQITRNIFHTHGIKGLYSGGVVTSLRDSIGYGFYFWTYEATTRALSSYLRDHNLGEGKGEAAKVLLCGGLAGVVTWASVFPLDVIKTRVQTQVSLFGPVYGSGARSALLGNLEGGRRLGAVEMAKQAYRTEGMGVFFKGLGVCSVRAFVVNAAQWAVYEWIMRELNPRRAEKGAER